MSSKGGLVQTIVVNPVKSALTVIFIIALLLILLLPANDAISTFGSTTVTLSLAAGVVVGSIPPGIEAFKNGFKAMSEYQPQSFGSSNTPCPLGIKTQKC